MSAWTIDFLYCRLVVPQLDLQQAIRLLRKNVSVRRLLSDGSVTLQETRVSRLVERVTLRMAAGNDAHRGTLRLQGTMRFGYDLKFCTTTEQQAKETGEFMTILNDEEKGTLTTLQKLSRRAFLSRAGAAGVATATAGMAAQVASAAPAVAEGQVQDSAAGTVPAGTVPITLSVNGTKHKVNIDPRATVLDTLRETLHLTGTKKGCDHGQCGACTIHVNGRRANSCLLFAAMQQNAEITTIEGLGTPETMHPVQAAFLEHDGYQCGYCTSGQMMSAAAMLKEPWGPKDEDVKEALSGNICRCGAYPNIVAAVQACRNRTS